MKWTLLTVHRPALHWSQSATLWSSHLAWNQIQRAGNSGRRGVWCWLLAQYKSDNSCKSTRWMLVVWQLLTNNSSAVQIGNWLDYRFKWQTVIFWRNYTKKALQLLAYFVHTLHITWNQTSKCNTILPNIYKNEASRTRTYLMICLIWGKMEVSRDTL